MSLLRLLVPICALATACSAPTLGPAPEISDLTLQSPDPSDTTHVHGSVHVTDPAGLTALTLNVTISGPDMTEALPAKPIDSTVEGQLEANVSFKIESKAVFGTGTYQVAITVTEAGTTSNTLTSTMLVQ